MMRYSIKSTLLFGALFSIMATAVIMGIIGIRLTGDFLTMRFHSNFELIAQNLAKNAELGVLLKDITMLDRLVNNMLDQKDIKKITITSGGKEILVTLEKKISSDIVKIITPILTPSMMEEILVDNKVKEYDTIGYVELGYSKESLDLLKQKMTLRFLFFALLLAFISGGWYWFFSRTIVKTLNHLVDVSREVSRGHMNLKARGGGFYETKMLASAFNDMLNDLKEQRKALEKAYADMAEQKSMANVGKFSIMVAHEIKNPLSIIKGSMEILKKPGINEAMRKNMFTYQEEEISRINLLVENFLLYSKPFEPDMNEVDMNAFLQKLIIKLDCVNFEKNIKLIQKIEKRTAPVMCDTPLMERALNNILKNCFEACGPDDIVEVHSRTLEGHWICLIKDSGPGIKKEVIDNIFKPFFTTKAKGTGLGLAIVKDIILLHDGKIKVGNNEKQGASFKIYLPCVKGIDYEQMAHDQ
jgi:signal transduction histidine kinase